MPKANPPITVGWPDMDTVMSNPAFAADVFYNSLPTYGQGTTTAFVQHPRPGFPSATAVTFLLDPNGLTSVYGEPMDRADRDHLDHGAAGGDVAAQQRHRLHELPRPHRVFHARSHDRAR